MTIADWITFAEWMLKDEGTPDRHVLRHILKGQHIMALDLTKLNASIAKLSTDVDALVAAHTDPAAQAAVDAAQVAVDAVDAKVVAAVTPAPAG